MPVSVGLGVGGVSLSSVKVRFHLLCVCLGDLGLALMIGISGSAGSERVLSRFERAPHCSPKH